MSSSSSSTASESASGREAEEGEEEEDDEDEENGRAGGRQRSSEEGDEEEEDDDDDDDDGDEDDDEEKNGGDAEEDENGAASPADESPEPVPARKSRRNSFSGTGAAASEDKLTTLAFPISRVRRLVKSEVDVQWVGMEAGFLIAKAAELFLEKFVEDAFEMMRGDERTVLSYKDLASHVSSSYRFDFLSDFIPETVPAVTALSVRGQSNK